MTTIEELISNAGFQLESLRQEVIDDTAHSVVECLVRRALDELAAEWGQDLSNHAIESIAIEMELESLASEIESCIDACATDDSLEERYLDEVRELVCQQIEEQEN